MSNGIWTRARLAGSGYVVDACCQKCGLRDDLHHRLWTCTDEEVKRARAGVLAKASEGVEGRARSTPPDSVEHALYTKAWVVYDPSCWCGPA